MKNNLQCKRQNNLFLTRTMSMNKNVPLHCANNNTANEWHPNNNYDLLANYNQNHAENQNKKHNSGDYDNNLRRSKSSKAAHLNSDFVFIKDHNGFVEILLQIFLICV